MGEAERQESGPTLTALLGGPCVQGVRVASSGTVLLSFHMGVTCCGCDGKVQGRGARVVRWPSWWNCLSSSQPLGANTSLQQYSDPPLNEFHSIMNELAYTARLFPVKVTPLK